MHSIPEPAIKRLSILYQYLCRLAEDNILQVSSRELAESIGSSAHSIRKDISYLNAAQISGSKYSVDNLKAVIGEKLNFNRDRSACVVGLGRIGSAVLQYSSFRPNGFAIKAGFDSNINKIETMQAECPLFPSYQIEEKVQELGIELAVLAVPTEFAQMSSDRLAAGGIKGIVNFTSGIIRCDKNIHVIDIDVTREFRILSAMISLSGN